MTVSTIGTYEATYEAHWVTYRGAFTTIETAEFDIDTAHGDTLHAALETEALEYESRLNDEDGHCAGIDLITFEEV